MKEAGAVSYSPGEASGHVVKEEGGAGARSSSLFSSGSSSSGGSSSAPPPSGKKKPAAAARSPPPVALYKLDPAILENIFLYLRISEVVSLSMVCIESRDRSLLELVTMVEGGFSQPVALIGNLYRMPRLHVLDLTGNEIGVEGARALAIAGTNGYCRSLSILNLSQNNLGEEGVRELTISWASGWAASVSSIDLSHNYVGPAGLALIASIMAAGGLPSLQRLDLSCNTTLEAFQAAPFDVGDFGALCRIPSLRLFASGLREEEALQLATALRQTAQVNVLQRLDLSWNHIKAQGFHHLLSAFHHHGRGRSLTHLNLRHNEIDPGDAHPFPGLPNGLATALPNLLELVSTKLTDSHQAKPPPSPSIHRHQHRTDRQAKGRLNPPSPWTSSQGGGRQLGRSSLPSMICGGLLSLRVSLG